MKYLLRIENYSFCLEYEISQQEYDDAYEFMLNDKEHSNLMLLALAVFTLNSKAKSEFERKVLADKECMCTATISVGIYVD